MSTNLGLNIMGGHAWLGVETYENWGFHVWIKAVAFELCSQMVCCMQQFNDHFKTSIVMATLMQATTYWKKFRGHIPWDCLCACLTL